jgi:uncharacterized membrane protein YfcA
VIEPWQYPLLFLAAFAAGFVDSIAGGGGLITVPVLLGLGLPAPLALGTNKLQATFGSGSAAWHYARAGLVDWRECGRGFFITCVGAGVGTLLVQQLDDTLLRRLIPILLLAVAALMILRPRLGEQDLHPRMNRLAFELCFGLGLGFYDGFFGPGTGTFWTLALMLGLGLNLTRATAHTKVMNFASNAISLLVFLVGGQVLFLPGLVMGLAQLLGASLGARMVVRRGTRLIRPIFLTVVLALSARLLWKAYFP